MTEEVGYKKPPKDTRFGGKRANKQNKSGKPKDFLALRKLAQQIAHEEMPQAKGAARTVTELILRKWAGSNDARLQMAFVEYAFGKVPAPTEITGEIEIKNADAISDRLTSRLSGLAARIGAQADSGGDSAE